jgi:hypothetical protein
MPLICDRNCTKMRKEPRICSSGLMMKNIPAQMIFNTTLIVILLSELPPRVLHYSASLEIAL